jgi:hypothetical protein
VSGTGARVRVTGKRLLRPGLPPSAGAGAGLAYPADARKHAAYAWRQMVFFCHASRFGYAAIGGTDPCSLSGRQGRLGRMIGARWEASDRPQPIQAHSGSSDTKCRVACSLAGSRPASAAESWNTPSEAPTPRCPIAIVGATTCQSDPHSGVTLGMPQNIPYRPPRRGASKIGGVSLRRSVTIMIRTPSGCLMS